MPFGTEPGKGNRMEEKTIPTDLESALKPTARLQKEEQMLEFILAALK